MKVLGFSVGHDKGAVIIENNEVKVGITQERLTRIKHDGAYQGGIIPFESINYCLNSLGITHRDIDLFVYSTTEEIDNVHYDFFNVYKEVSYSKLLFIPHHLAHAYSTFFSSGFEESAVVVADASGSILNFKNKLSSWYKHDEQNLSTDEDWAEGISIYFFNKKEYKEVYKKWIKYPVPLNTNESTSLGTSYSQGSLQLVFDPKTNTWPAGKLMGLASYADKKIVDKAPQYVIHQDDDNIFIPNNIIYPKVTWKSDFYSKSCVAGIYQRVQEQSSIILSKIAKKFTASENICVAGGSFLNCNSNELISNSGIYKNYYFLPPSDDSGIPLGCAWYAYQKLIDIEKTSPLIPYLGKKYSRNEIIETLNESPQFLFEECENLDILTDKVSHWLSENRVIGWYQDGSEIGPRALGNRSILASPINSWMKGHINSDIKKREWYRPFGPSVLFEYQKEIFESDVYSPYMLITTNVKEEWKSKIPAVVHIDGSVRHQSVTSKNNHRFYKLIEKFYEKTGVPLLLNTSFNGPHEPIVETPKDAVKTFLEINLDILVLNNFIIYKNI